MRMTKLILSLSLFAVLTACFEQSDPTSMSGKQLFEAYCVECHKDNGKGRFLLGIPANANTQLDREALVVLIIQGLPSHTDMPTFPQFNRNQAEHIINHLETLAD